MAGKTRFTRIPKTTELVAAGVPAEAIGTYCCLADYANNKNGLCWPKMETLAKTLGRSVRTVQRHLHLLRELGLIEFVERRRNRGRFSSYLYRVLHIVATTGHGKGLARSGPIYERTKQLRTTPKSPSKLVTEGYEWLFGQDAPADQQEVHDRMQKQLRLEEAKRRSEGYEWFFGE